MAGVVPGPPRSRTETLIDPFELTPGAQPPADYAPLSQVPTPRVPLPQGSPAPPAAAPARSARTSAVSRDELPAAPFARRGPIDPRSPRARAWCSGE